MNVELFPCSGGMAEGFRRAGITFDFAFDVDPNACDSYERNLGHRPIQIDVRDLLRMVRGGWRPGGGGINLLLADPPCTPWSRAGKRLGTDDERDMLEDTAKLIALLQPRYYLIGNVPGLQDSTSWHVVQRVIGGLGRHGYCVADYVALDAADYGVPQHRVRPFWFGHPKGTPCIRWPSPTHAAPVAALPGLGLEPWVTCRDALQHLPLEQLGRPVRLKRMDPKHPPCKPSDPGTTVRSGGGNGNAAPHLELRIPENHRPLKLDRPSKTIMAKRTQVDAQVLALDAPLRAANINLPPADPDAPHRTIVGAGGGHQFMLSAEPEARPPRAFDGAAKMLEWPWDRPSTTVTTREAGPPPGHHPESGSILSQPNAVVLSERAAGILQGFPEDWHFAGKTKRARWSQLGQAMPPQLAEAVAGAVRAVMERDGLESEREIAGALA